jgi:hypothetical protein
MPDYLENCRKFKYPGGPFRTSEAHRLPKSAAYVSAGFREVKAKTARKARFLRRIGRAIAGCRDLNPGAANWSLSSALGPSLP